ncbi:MAG: preprotein translocase subunit SecG [Oscillospiraceae bacterium]|nr:preprotein translocase subunit SecG [Oscillospiraceae bacterium]
MTTVEWIFGAAILIFALFLVIAVLMQHGKSKHLSGTIAGGAETFFGKEKGKTIDKMLSKLTAVVAVIFVVAVLVLYVLVQA